MTTLTQRLQQTPYQGYSYAYPHKTAYRRLPAPLPLGEVWANESRDSLFLYFHVPFCEMRCGFCNLFTTANPHAQIETEYLAALTRQAQVVKAAINNATFTRLAIGGGTPTYLNETELQQLFDLAEQFVDPRTIPVSVETSPLTATTEKLRVLQQRGVDRISIGVQSFDEAEVRAVGRSQKTADVLAALQRLKAADFATLNIDLMYGLPGQSVTSWRQSVQTALEFAPTELYLYPLYIRPLTGIGQRRIAEDIRLTCYREARALLLDAGYQQISMRMFQRAVTATTTTPAYCCQTDGLIGLGCGARSYTRTLHSSNEYAVGASGVRSIIQSYLHSSDDDFAQVNYGFALNDEEQRRRYVIQSLLQVEGLNRNGYQQQFASDVLADFPALMELMQHEFALINDDEIRLTPRGLEQSDLLGPWLYSESVRALMQAYELQ
jgi:oxygen-independent coproporphyrinogen-3 oxidase